MCAKEKTASFVNVAPLKASKLKARRCVHKFGRTLLPLPLCCLFTAHPPPHSSPSDSLYTSFTLHEVPRAQLGYTNALTTLQKIPTPSSFSLSPSSLILFYIEKRKISAVRASWIPNFRTVIQKHINYHYYKRCARLTTALYAPPRSAPEVPLQVLQIMLAISRNFPVRFALLPCQIFLLSSLLTSSNSHV